MLIKRFCLHFTRVNCCEVIITSLLFFSKYYGFAQILYNIYKYISYVCGLDISYFIDFSRDSLDESMRYFVNVHQWNLPNFFWEFSSNSLYVGVFIAIISNEISSWISRKKNFRAYVKEYICMERKITCFYYFILYCCL